MRDEGFEDIQESAAARGRLGAGGTLKDLTELNTNLAATVVPQLQQQRFNQLFSLLGLGESAAVGAGAAGINTAGNIGQFLMAGGNAQAQNAINQGQIGANLVSDLTGTFGAQRGGAFESGGPGFNVLNQSQNQTPGGGTVDPNRFGNVA